MLQKAKVLPLFIALIVAGILGFSGFKSVQTIKTKAVQQLTVLDDFRSWKTKYLVLTEFNKDWETAIPSVSSITDILTVHKLLIKEGVSTNPDTLSIEKIAEVVGMDAYKICVASLGQGGIIIHDETPSKLMVALHKIAENPEFEYEKVSLSMVNGKPIAKIKGFCVLARAK